MDLNRATGRSTKQAFEILAKCYDKKNMWVYVVDHHGTHRASQHLMMTIQTICNAMGFDGFEFDKQRLAIRLLSSAFDKYAETRIL